MNQLRQLAPQVLAALVRRYGDFGGAEDAVQEALLAAATTWPEQGEPDNPRAWLIRVASRRLANQFRADAARRRREELAASWSMHRPPDPAPHTDDTLERLTGNAVVRLNRAAAVAMVEGPAAGLALLRDLEGPLGDHHRLAAVRAHLHERAGDGHAAIEGYRAAASHTGNLREREYLLMQAARVATYGCRM